MSTFGHIIKNSYLGFIFLFFLSHASLAQPSGFSTSVYASNYTTITAFTFDPIGRIFVAEKEGKVMIINANGTKQTTPLLNISDEVFNRVDAGLLNIVLDPDFLNNGYIYLYYVVDRHYLFYYGTNSYNTTLLDGSMAATICRICRYTVDLSSSPLTTVAGSRHVLVGETYSTGIPAIADIHSGGGLAFGQDGSLLISTGDGANQFDLGGTTEGNLAVSSGIIPAAENIGQYRSQLLSSLCGKVLRIDPITGDGISSNPYYDMAHPRSAQSRIWARGLRNPFKLAYQPNTGEHHQEDGNPGVFIIGDVGRYDHEEIDVVNTPSLNFGWPYYEGMTLLNWQTTNNAYMPSVHQKPSLQYRNNNSKALINGVVSNVTGNLTNGNCVIGGSFYTNSDFPSAYTNKYYFADYSNKWISYVQFDASNNPIFCDIFAYSSDIITHLTTSTVLNGIFYANGATQIKRISYGNSNNKPIAKITTDKTYGTSPLTVRFSGIHSYDVEGDSLTYQWNFGDNTAIKTSLEPHHQYIGNGNSSFWAKLTVTDRSGLIGKDSVKIFLNNFPPTISSISLDTVNNTIEGQGKLVDLIANVTDDNTPAANINYEWWSSLAHNDHEHYSPSITGNNNTLALSELICESGHATYWQKAYFKACDEQGLCSNYEKNVYIACNAGLSQNITFANIGNKTVTSPPTTLTATASSGLPLSYQVVSGPAYSSAGSLYLTGQPGIVKVVALQHGDTSYQPAPAVFQTFDVFRNTLSQSMTFDSIPPKTITQTAFLVNATVSSGRSILYYIVSGPATIAGNTISLNGTEGEVVVRAVQEGNFGLSSVFKDRSFLVYDPCPTIKTIISGSTFTSNSVLPLIKASSQILTENPVTISSGSIIFQAGNNILLQPGFQVQSGATFKADIKNCNE